MKQSKKLIFFTSCALIVSATGVFASEALWQSYFASAQQADDAGKYGEACKLYSSALKEAESFGENDERFLKTLRGLAESCDNDGKLDQSEPLFKRLLDIYEKNPKKNRINIAWVLRGLATGYKTQARFTEAIALQKRVLEVLTQESGPNSRNVAVALDGLGRIYAEQGNLQEALPLHEQALKILAELAKTEKDQHRKEVMLDNMSVALRNAADAESYLGRYDDAIESLKQSIAIQEKISDKPGPLLASTYGSMATAYRRKGNYSEAERLYKIALPIYENTVGPNHIDTAVIANGLAATYTLDHKPNEAQLYYERALDTIEKSFGPEHPDIALICRNFGNFHFQQHNYAQAESLFLRALAIREKSAGENSTATLNLINDLARLYKEMGKVSEAKTLYQRLLTADEAAFGSNSSVVASDLNNLAEVNALLKNAGAANEQKSRAQKIEQSLPGASRLAALSQMTTEKGTIASSAATNNPVKDKWALVVGISNFEDPSINLKYAAKDAIDFKNYLVSSANFAPDHVKLLTDANATRDNIVAELGDKWLGRLANKDDMVVIYISSHGSTTKDKVGVNFLVAADTNKNALLGTGIPMQWLSEIIKEQVHSDRVVLVLDVCHSGAASSGEKGLSRESNFDVENIKVGTGQAVLCSSLADQVSWESKQYENSVFTRRLIEGLKQRGGSSSLSEAYAHMRSEVESEVLRDRGELQTPVLNMRSWAGADPILSAKPTSPRPGLASGSQ